MSNQSPEQLSMFDPISFAVDFHAKTYPSPETVRAWMEEKAVCGLNTLELLNKLSHCGLSWKMYRDCFQAKVDGILPSSFKAWHNAGMWGFGKLLTVNISECPKQGAGCLLSDILEESAPPKYYLTGRACRGILRRAQKRGKAIAPILHRALRQVAGEWNEPEKAEGKTL